MFWSIIAFVALVLLAVYIWPTRYRLTKVGSNLVRIDRFTYRVQYYNDSQHKWLAGTRYFEPPQRFSPQSSSAPPANRVWDDKAMRYVTVDEAPRRVWDDKLGRFVTVDDATAAPQRVWDSKLGRFVTVDPK